MGLTTYGRSSGFCVDPIEKKPLNHFFRAPARFHSAPQDGHLGCRVCQNWAISKERDMDWLAAPAASKTIAAGRAYFGDFDPFGDFDLLFGAARLNMKIVDVPIRYRDRTYGSTNIHRWSHGWLLLRMVLFAARKLKFV